MKINLDRLNIPAIGDLKKYDLMNADNKNRADGRITKHDLAKTIDDDEALDTLKITLSEESTRADQYGNTNLAERLDRALEQLGGIEGEENDEEDSATMKEIRTERMKLGITVVTDPEAKKATEDTEPPAEAEISIDSAALKKISVPAVGWLDNYDIVNKKSDPEPDGQITINDIADQITSPDELKEFRATIDNEINRMSIQGNHTVADRLYEVRRLLTADDPEKAEAYDQKILEAIDEIGDTIGSIPSKDKRCQRIVSEMPQQEYDQNATAEDYLRDVSLPAVGRLKKYDVVNTEHTKKPDGRITYHDIIRTIRTQKDWDTLIDISIQERINALRHGDCFTANALDEWFMDISMDEINSVAKQVLAEKLIKKKGKPRIFIIE